MKLIYQLKLLNKIDEMVISGWDRYYDQFSEKNYFVSRIVTNLIDDIKITTLSEISYNDLSLNLQYKYTLDNSSLNINKDYVLLTNLGYNFFRIVLFLWKKKQKILTPLFENINFFKKIVYRILGVKFLKLSKVHNKKKEDINLPVINFKYKGKDLSKTLNLRIEQEKNNFINLANKSRAIDNLFNRIRIKLVITNATKGIIGFFIEAAYKLNITSICIPHGTLTKSFNKYDAIYKQIIAEAVTSKNANYNVSQSNISKNFFDTNKKKYNNIINSGNLIFSKKKENRKKNKKILFAVTIKDLESIQLVGVDMYYEFIENLYFLENFSKKYNFNILIKLHPAAYSEYQILKKIFKKLNFSTKKISRTFDSIFATLSFSSTVIEDSLNSKCPVILLDRSKKYKHCDAEENVNKTNSAVYYVTNEEDLYKCLETIKKSEKIDFSKYVPQRNYKYNINNFLSKFF